MVTVRLFAAASAAAGNRTEQQFPVTCLRDALDELTRQHGGPMARVLARCAFAVDGVVVANRNADLHLRPDSTIDVLPPFAGG